MARKQNIRFVMKSKLESMAAYGTSKHADKRKTSDERKTLKKKGATYRECLEINYFRNKVYSYNTMKTYMRELDKFADYLEKNGMKKADWEIVKSHDIIQGYIDYLVEEKKASAWSVRTSASAIVKVFDLCASDFKLPIRHSYEIKRGSFPVVNDRLNEKRAHNVLSANRIIGCRKNELKNLKVSDFNIYVRNGHRIVEISYKGKGGKNCHNYIYDTDKAAQDFIIRLIAGKKHEEKVFADVMKEFTYDADIHTARREAAVRMYQNILNHPQDRDFYLSELKRVFDEKGKLLPSNLDVPYKLRGKNKTEHERMEIDTEVDRFAALCVSVLLLNHYRVNVSVTNYLLHP